MHRSTLYIGGCELHVHGAIGPDSWWEELKPFQACPTHQSPRYTLELHLTHSIDEFQSKRPPLDAFTYTRHDLSVWANGKTVRAYYDAGHAGFLAVLELAIYRAIEAMGGILLHAAAGVHFGQAVVMPGPTGTGKSTASHGGFHRVLSDERVIILPDGCHGYRVWGTPFWSDGRRYPLDTGSAPLGSFARLHHGSVAHAEAMETAEQAAWVMRSVICYDHDPLARFKALERTCAMVESVQSLAITYPKEGSWVSSTLNQTGPTL